MKKLLLACAAVAACSGAANAATYTVSSNITGLQLWAWQIELLTYEPGGYYSNVQFSGTATDADDDGVIDSSQLFMSGQLGFVANGLPVRHTFALSEGHYAAGQGTVFESGVIVNETFQGEDGWAVYGSLDAYIEPVRMLVGEPGHYVGNPGAGAQTIAGLLLAPGTTALPGLWDGIVGSAGYNNATAAYWMIGADLGLFLQGTVTLTPVPVPAGIWLFASGLVGLVGMSRKQRVRC